MGGQGCAEKAQFAQLVHDLAVEFFRAEGLQHPWL